MPQIERQDAYDHGKESKTIVLELFHLLRTGQLQTINGKCHDKATSDNGPEWKWFDGLRSHFRKDFLNEKVFGL